MESKKNELEVNHKDISFTDRDSYKENISILSKEEHAYIHKSKTEQMCDNINDIIHNCSTSGFTLITHHTNSESTKELARSLYISLWKTFSNYKKMHGGKADRHMHIRKYKLKNSSKAINVGNIEIINSKAVYVDIPKNNKRKTKKERRLSKQRNIRRKRGYGLHMERLNRRKLIYG